MSVNTIYATTAKDLGQTRSQKCDQLAHVKRH